MYMLRLKDQLNYAWRVLATGFSFAAFAIGGTLLALTWFQGIRLLVGDRGRQKTLTRHSLSVVFQFYITMMKALGLFTLTVSDRQKLKDRGQLVVANHPSLLDVVFLISMIRQADCVVKASLRQSWFTRSPLLAADYISNQDPQLLDTCIAVLNRGDTLIIFPEGTRSEPGAPLRFTRGAANMAVLSGHPVTPVRIRCEPATLLKGQRWYHVPRQKPHFSIEVLDDIAVTPYQQNRSRSIAVRRLTAYMQQLLS